MMERLGRLATARALDALEAQAAADLPGVAVTRDCDRIVLAAPGIVLRSLTEAGLRGLATSALRGRR